MTKSNDIDPKNGRDNVKANQNFRKFEIKDPVNIIIGNVNTNSLPTKLDQSFYILMVIQHIDRSGGAIVMCNK